MSAHVLAPLALAILVAAAPSAQQPTFRARVEGVRIDVLVSQNGRPVDGLGPGDFDVRDNGVPQSVDLVSLRDVPVGVVLALDLSGSVDGPQLAALQRASGLLLDALGPDDTAALVTFGRNVVQRVPVTRQREDVRRALAGVRGSGETSLVDASLAAMLLGDTEGSRTLVMLFSDGVDTGSFMRPESVLETARRVNGVVYAVSSGAVENRFLLDLAEATSGRVIDIGTAGDPGQAFVEILQEFRRRYVITYTPAGVMRGGWHTLSVRVNGRNARVQARPGYFSSQP